MKKYLLLLFLVASAVAYDIPTLRKGYWDANIYTGVIGGIPTNRTQFCDISVSIPGTNIVADKTGSVACDGAVQAAIERCPTNQYIYLPKGVYLMVSGVAIDVSFGKPWVNNISFVGDSVQSTNTTILLRITNSSKKGFTIGSSRIADGGQFQTGSAGVALSSDLPTGSSSVTLSSIPNSILVGGIIWFDENNDGTYNSAVGSGTATGVAATAYDRPRNGTRNRASYHMVTNITGTTVSFVPPIPLGFTVAAGAIAIAPNFSRNNAAYGMNVGFENIHFQEDATANMSSILYPNGVTGFYVKGCRFSKVKSRAIQPSAVVCSEIRDNDFITAGAFTVNKGYVLEGTHCGGLLIENNAVNEWYVGWMLETSVNNVIAYNASFWGHSQVTSVQISDSATHASAAMFNLWEGNIFNRIQFDYYWGKAPNHTVFRNHLRGTDTNTTANQFCLMMDTGSISNNVVGNVLGTPGQTWYTALTNSGFSNSSNMIYRLGYPEIGNNTWPGVNNGTMDLTVTNTAIFHGNYYVNESGGWTTEWRADTADHTLPTSLYRSSKPTFMNGWYWPSHGPDIANKTNNIPASARLLGLANPGIGLGSGRPGLMPLY